MSLYRFVWGPLSALVLAMAVLACGMDQAHKWWMLGPYDITARQPVPVTGFLDLVMVWNRGISYGLLAQNSSLGRWLLITLAFVVAFGLWLWAVRARTPLGAAATGLVIGGALGNGIDRVVHGAVADFFLVHAFDFNWYVFNVADVAIVIGVVLLLFDTPGQVPKTPRNTPQP